MSSIIAYQRLFEIRILHEYYLLGPNVLSFFDLPEAERDDIFHRRVASNQYQLRSDLQIEPTEKTQTLLKGLKWKFLQTIAGFSIAASAVPFQLQNGTMASKPMLSPASGSKLLFYIRPKNRLFYNFTALPLRKISPQPIYYFTNRASSIAGTDFATLSAPVAPLQAGKPYEMGELALDGGDLKEALQNNDGTNPAAHWRDLPGTGYVNESDRICLPKVFHYPFAVADNVQTAIFTLEKPTGTPLFSLTIEAANADTPVTNAVVRFKPTPPDGLYTLKIDAGPVQKDLEVFLTDDFDPNALGIVHLNLDETDSIYRLLGAEGEIRNENTNPGTRPIPPIFEIRLRSRKTFWRYLSYFNNRRIEPKGLADHLKKEGNTTVTIDPQPFALLPIQVTSPKSGVKPVALPNAEPAALRSHPPDFLYADIRTFRTNDLSENPIP